MNKKKLNSKGRYMSMLLRHKPELEALNMDNQGYVLVSQICYSLKIDKEELNWIVENNSKKRFEYSIDNKRIRATQGHSFEIDHGYIGIEPPDILYHGTSLIHMDKIKQEGLKKMGRQYVHLTQSEDIAVEVGLRYAKIKNNLVLIAIDSKKMFEDGHEFYYTSNAVYLTDNVPSKYFIINK